MTVIDVFFNSIVKWGYPIANDLFPILSKGGKLGEFAIRAVVSKYVSPKVENLTKFIPEEEKGEILMSVLDECIADAEKNGGVFTVSNLAFEKEAIYKLKTTFAEMLGKFEHDVVSEHIPIKSTPAVENVAQVEHHEEKVESVLNNQVHYN